MTYNVFGGTLNLAQPQRQRQPQPRFGCGKGWNVISAGCRSIYHVSSRSGEAKLLLTAIHAYLYLYLLL